MADPHGFFEQLPERVWPWLPIAVVIAAAAIVVGTIVVALALT